MGMPHWEKRSLLSEIQEGKVVFFLFQLQVTFIQLLQKLGLNGN